MKTLITTALTLGMASFAGAATILEDAVVIDYAYSDTTTYNAADYGVDSFCSLGNPYNAQASTTRANLTFTIVFDAKELAKIDLTTSDNLIARATWGGSSWWGVGTNTSEQAKGWWNSGLYSNGPTSANSLASYAAEDGTITMTVVTGYTTDSQEGTRLYMGTNDTSFFTNTGLKFGAPNLTISTIEIGDSLSSAITQFYVFDTALSQTEVAEVINATAQVTAGTYIPAVPEPATASLSLLGLAALMMRRRRA